ncbi:MAG TPA: hypothetical protein VF599_05705 [Pyrinomonadaceae bacterium]
MKKIHAVILILTLNSSLYGAAPAWFSKLKQIELLKTTRQNVEELLGRPKITDAYESRLGQVVEYKLKAGELTVLYSLGRCSKNSEQEYDVEKNVIIDLEMNLTKAVSISTLGLDLNDFNKTEIRDLRGVFDYRNEDSGEHYLMNEFYKDGTQKIQKIEFFPSKSQEKLKCQSSE